jgi:protein-tyrosine phosphatase
MHTDASPSRHLPWDACYNVRDVGGYATADGGQIRWRALVRADNLCRLSPAGRAALVDYGVRTIIDLRSPAELAYAPHPFAPPHSEPGAPTYLHLPLLDETDQEAIARLDSSRSVQEMYILMIEQYPSQIAAIIRGVAQAEDGGVLVHCFAGKDRTGVVVALLLAVAGAESATIAADYAASDSYLQPLYAEVLDSLAHDPPQQRQLASLLVSPAGGMHATLAHLDKAYGGPEAYLQAIGVSQQDLQQLRQRLRQSQL